MANRKVPAHEQEVFQKYVQSNVRRLTRDEALVMFQLEYGLHNKYANLIFDHFDADQNGLLSLWEFHHFCTVVGPRIKEVTERFEEIDNNNDGALSTEDASKALETMTEADGKPLEAKEWEFFFKTAALENGKVDLGHFIDMLARLRQYKKQKAKK